MWKLLVILAVIKYNMLVFRKCQVLDKMWILKHFNQTLYLTGTMIRVLGPPRLLGPWSVLGPSRVLGPHRLLGPPRILGPDRVLGTRRVLGPGSRFSGTPLICKEISPTGFVNLLFANLMLFKILLFRLYFGKFANNLLNYTQKERNLQNFKPVFPVILRIFDHECHGETSLKVASLKFVHVFMKYRKLKSLH